MSQIALYRTHSITEGVRHGIMENIFLGISIKFIEYLGIFQHVGQQLITDFLVKRKKLPVAMEIQEIHTGAKYDSLISLLP